MCVCMCMCVYVYMCVCILVYSYITRGGGWELGGVTTVQRAVVAAKDEDAEGLGAKHARNLFLSPPFLPLTLEICPVTDVGWQFATTHGLQKVRKGTYIDIRRPPTRHSAAHVLSSSF